MSTAYHPETDGQTEVLNRVLEHYLRSFVHSNPSKWGNFLSLAEWSYNTSSHSSTGTSPFHIIFGRPPPSIPNYILGTSNVEAVDSMLSYRQQLLTSIQCKLLKAQTRMKLYADKGRREVSFQIGDLVYVKLKPYRQSSSKTSPHNKLAKRFYGPYVVVERIGAIAYKLALPTASRIHLVFHCSLLKKQQGPATDVIDPLPPLNVDNHPLISPLAILDTKLDSSTTPPTRLVLVQWLGLSPEDTTWEPWNELCAQFHLEDKVFFPPGGIVSNINQVG